MEISKKIISFEELLDSEFLPIEIKDKMTQGMIEVFMEKMRRYTGGDSSVSKERALYFIFLYAKYGYARYDRDA